jgi:hypothetical protein
MEVQQSQGLAHQELQGQPCEKAALAEDSAEIVVVDDAVVGAAEAGLEDDAAAEVAGM